MSRHRHPPWLFAALVFLSTIVVVTFFAPTQAIAGESGTQLQAVLQTGSVNAVPDGSGADIEVAAVSGQMSPNAASHSDEAVYPVQRTNQPEVWPNDLVLQDIFGTLESDLAEVNIFRQTDADETQKSEATNPASERRNGADSTTRTGHDDMSLWDIIGTRWAGEVPFHVICPINGADSDGRDLALGWWKTANEGRLLLNDTMRADSSG